MDENEKQLSLENAKWAASQLGNLSRFDQNQLFNAFRAGNRQSFEKILFENQILNTQGIWQGIEDINTQRSQGANIEIESKDKDKNSSPRNPQSLALGSIIAGVNLLRRGGSYEESQKEADRYAEYFAKKWEEEYRRYNQNPSKRNAPVAKSRLEAYERARREYHELLVRADPKKAREWLSKDPQNTQLDLAFEKVSLENKNLTYSDYLETRRRYIEKTAKDYDSRDPSARYLDRSRAISNAQEEIEEHLVTYSPQNAKKWAAQYNDPELTSAIERKRQKDITYTYQNPGITSRLLRRNKPSPTQITKPQPLTSPIPASLPVLQNNFANAPQTTNQSKSQSQQSTQNQNWLYKRFFKTRLGNRLSKSKSINRFKNLNKKFFKLKKFLDPIGYLERLFARSILGSLLSSIAGFLTTAISAIIGVATSAAAATISVISLVLAKIITGIGITVTTISLPAVIIIALIIFIFVIIGQIFFNTSDLTKPITNSRYAGISYTIYGPQSSPNGVDLRYEIIVIYDKRNAVDPIENISVSADIPEETTLIPSGTTGIYRSPTNSSAITWRLKDNSPSETGEQTMYSFTLILRPQDDSTFDVSISILGATGGGGPPATGDSCSGKYNSVNAPKGNFGDPSCNYTLNDFGNELKSKDPKNYRFWYLLSECESGHRPNAYFRCNSDGSVCTPDPKGAWGAFQMGSNRNPLAYNRGNVEWKEQIQVAVDREKIVLEPRNLDFDYWQCETNVCRGAPELCTNGEYNTIR